MTPITYTPDDLEGWWSKWSAAHVVPLCGVDGCSQPADTCPRHGKQAPSRRAEYKTFPTRFDCGPFATDCPPELVGTCLDPKSVGNPVPIAAIKAAMAERKAISRKSLPLRVVSFDA
jgi:hypothetical protein